MGRARYIAALVMALVLSGAPRPLGPISRAEPESLRAIAAGGVSALVPSDWEYRPIESEASFLRGLQASKDLDRWEAATGRGHGMKAYWVDATQVRLPSDYYVLTARGPAMESLPDRSDCRSDSQVYVNGENRSRGLPDGYLATAAGTCQGAGGRTRWAAFVAAPGFGPLRAIGIPQSGLYFAMASVREGPGDDRILDRLLTGVSFGQTQVSEFLRAAKARMI